MAEQSKDILSEYTKDITPEQRAELQEKVSNMTEEELKESGNKRTLFQNRTGCRRQ